MVVTSPPLPALSADSLSLFYASDELLADSRFIVFYGPSSTTSAAANNSRIQAHIFSPTGAQSYPRLSISPSSQLYAAVECLPREEQGDEICRGLAFALYKYFSELPTAVKDVWAKEYSSSASSLPSAPTLFSEAHAAMVSSRMLPITNAKEVVTDLKHAFSEQSLSWVDLDVVLPAGSMKELDRVRESIQFDDGEDEVAALRYGEYAPIVRLFGELDFLPTSRLKRAPSKPTAINRNLSFPRKQKETLRREMCELLDTEESYVSKLYDLVHSVAADFREKAAIKSAGSSSPSAKALEGLFPPSLDLILSTNSGFLDSVRTILEETENDAINDIEASVDDGVPYSNPKNAPRSDVTGTLALATCLLTWFPKFADCYAGYMQAHSDFAGYLRTFMKESGSSFSKRLHDTGEQRLMSMLIEPVQRLPRYNLYIDNIVKQLPFRHPALKLLLRARDQISEICTRDTPLTLPNQVIETLRRMVPSWPSSIRPQGRLITAVDVIELPPPFHPSDDGDGGSRPGIMLLFTECLILLRKPPSCTKSARALMADVDNPNQSTVEVDSTQGSANLVFHHRVMLNAIQLSEVAKGKNFQLTNLTSAATEGSRGEGSRRGGNGTVDRACPRVFLLAGSYEGKASRWVEEVTRARVEGRFPDSERDSHKWEVRTCCGGELNMFSAIFENTQTEAESADGRQHASIRVVIDPAKDSTVPQVGQNGIEVVVTIEIMDGGFYRLEIDSFNDYGSRDHLTVAELLPVLKKRLNNTLQMRHHLRNPAITAIMLLRNQQILRSLTIRGDNDNQRTSADKSFRPPSPVKMLTNLFGGTTPKNSISRRTHKALQVPTLGEIPRITPNSSKPPSREGDRNRSQNDISTQASAGVNGVNAAGELLGKVDETLASYILALHARKGNVVGKVLRARANADELAINELYNSMIEDPSNPQLAAQSTVDVLFSALEKFIKVAWKDMMGPVIALSTLSAIRDKSDTASQGDFEDFFRTKFAEMSPQNQRALRAIVRLLADLLDGTTNDSDRGILTASFAEVLVSDGNAHEYISLLDRFIEDIVVLFGRPGSSSHTSSVPGSMNSDVRSTSTAIGSLNSKDSSLRKKFGFGSLSRENSARSDNESKMTSVWRTWSKTGRGTGDKDGHGPLSSKPPTLSRSKSTETENYVVPKRGGRERPAIHGAFNFEQSPTAGRPPFNGGALDPIGEVPQSKKPPRKKRRSSLSDLHALQAAGISESWGATTPRTPGTPVTPRRLSGQISASPKSPLHSKGSGIPSPTRGSHANSPLKNENAPPSALPRPPVGPKPLTPAKYEAVTITSYSPSRRRNEATSAIPTLKGNAPINSPLTERPGSGNSTKKSIVSPKPVLGPSPTKRLRMQSPQKLRERLNAENKALQIAEAALQAELAKIGEEMTKMNDRSSPANKSGRGQPTTPTTQNADALAALEARVKAVESAVPSTFSDLHGRSASLGQDISTSLQVSETRCKKLDELYREANAENEALYLRFNEELARVLKVIKGGEGVDELRKKLKEATEEVSILKKENWRLKRENVGLRAQFRE